MDLLPQTTFKKARYFMRNIEPVTQREFVLGADATPMSTTDLKGNGTYVNEAFGMSAASRERSCWGSSTTSCATRTCHVRL